MNRGFITIAYGSPRFLRMGKALARSIRCHSPTAKLAVVTNATDDADVRALFDHVIPVDVHIDVRDKLHLFEYSPFDRTIFLDSDCLAFKDLDQLWPYYDDIPFATSKGRYVDRSYKAEPIDIRALLGLCGIERLPRFNGGFYYFDRSETAHQVFAKAKEVYRRSSEFQQYRHHAGFSDELAFGSAIEVLGIPMANHTDHFLLFEGWLQGHRVQGHRAIDVRKGYSRFVKDGKSRDPAIIHFVNQEQYGYVYLREMARLEGRKGISVIPEYVKTGARIRLRKAASRIYRSALRKIPGAAS